MFFSPRSLLLTASVLAFATPAAHAQSQRLLDSNALAWFTYNGDYKLTTKWTVHTEAQWRRVQLGAHPQQLLLRLGGIYKLPKEVELGGGYTFRYLSLRALP